jgi:hypothetical protein
LTRQRLKAEIAAMRAEIAEIASPMIDRMAAAHERRYPSLDAADVAVYRRRTGREPSERWKARRALLWDLLMDVRRAGHDSNKIRRRAGWPNPDGDELQQGTLILADLAAVAKRNSAA